MTAIGRDDPFRALPDDPPINALEFGFGLPGLAGPAVPVDLGDTIGAGRLRLEDLPID